LEIIKDAAAPRVVKILKNFVKEVFEKKFSNRAKLVEKSKYVKVEVNNKVKIAKLVALIKELVLENKPYIKQVIDNMERATSGTKNI
jgi:hypothetical protein